MFKVFTLVMVTILLAACAAAPSYEGYIHENNLAGVEGLYASGKDIDRLDYWGTPLGYAARVNNVEAARFLLERGAAVNKGNPEGYESKTPMHAAAANGSVEVAKLLLESGADLTILNRDKLTPYQVAIEKGQQGMIDLLASTNEVTASWRKAEQQDTITAYESFLANYPDSQYTKRAEQYIALLKTEQLEKEQAQQEVIAQQQKLERLEASLPVTVRRDKYMVSLSRFLKEGDYEGSLDIFPKLEALNVSKDPSLDFFYGEALLKTGDPTSALEKLYRYVASQGPSAAHYTKALEMINQAESQL